MADYALPPVFPVPVSREEIGRNQTAYLDYFNTAFQKHYEVSQWYVGFIPWLTTQKNDIHRYVSITLNAKNIAVTAESNAVGAWEDIQGYVIPAETALSVEESEEMNLKLLELILDNTLYNLNNNKGHENDI